VGSGCATVQVELTEASTPPCDRRDLRPPAWPLRRCQETRRPGEAVQTFALARPFSLAFIRLMAADGGPRCSTSGGRRDTRPLSDLAGRAARAEHRQGGSSGRHAGGRIAWRPGIKWRVYRVPRTPPRRLVPRHFPSVTPRPSASSHQPKIQAESTGRSQVTWSSFRPVFIPAPIEPRLRAHRARAADLTTIDCEISGRVRREARYPSTGSPFAACDGAHDHGEGTCSPPPVHPELRIR
jgi:hypothetical protein